jgi:hypothetical protein
MVGQRAHEIPYGAGSHALNHGKMMVSWGAKSGRHRTAIRLFAF